MLLVWIKHTQTSLLLQTWIFLFSACRVWKSVSSEVTCADSLPICSSCDCCWVFISTWSWDSRVTCSPRWPLCCLRLDFRELSSALWWPMALSSSAICNWPILWISVDRTSCTWRFLLLWIYGDQTSFTWHFLLLQSVINLFCESLGIGPHLHGTFYFCNL